MNWSPRKRVLTPVASIVAGALIVSGCTSALAPVTTPPDASKAPSPSSAVVASPNATVATSGADMVAVSASKPSAAAQAALNKCGIGDQIELKKVTGMGMIASPGDLPHYVPLTGREPQLAESGSAWIVTVHADIPQPGGSEVWTDPTCVVTGEESGWWATGPVTDTATGNVIQPRAPIQQPDRSIPPLAP